MVKILLERPVAVFMSFLALLIFSVMSFMRIPVSLLPDIDVPSISVVVNYPDKSPREIDRNIMRPLRESLSRLSSLSDLQSRSQNETGVLTLKFEYGTPMDLAYIEVNEKVDRMTSALPREMPRPKVIRSNVTDVPIARLQVVPKVPTNYVEITQLVETVIKKRLEQVDGVSVVDVNGIRNEVIEVKLDRDKMTALDVGTTAAAGAIQQSNQELGAVSIKDGHYRYYLKLATSLDDIESLNKVEVPTRQGLFVQLGEIATVKSSVAKIQGFHLLNQKEGLVVSIHKQSGSRMTEVVPALHQALEQFRTDYPSAEFSITQDQSLLLNASINNLRKSLLYGGLFAFIVLFIFIGNVRSAIIIGISLPVSIIVSFLIIDSAGMSLNIVSLSGMALGLGMLIDNAIIVIDNIDRKRISGETLSESCINGTNQVMAPLISSVLTTLAVFVPLVFLNGLSGSLFYDQAVAVAAVLIISLIVSFTLLPLLYKVLNRNKGRGVGRSPWFNAIHQLYGRVFGWTMRNPRRNLLLFVLGIPFVYFATGLKNEGLPQMEQTGLMLEIDWNEPITVNANKDRVVELIDKHRHQFDKSESDIGIQDFLLAQDHGSNEKAKAYFYCKSDESREQLQTNLVSYFAKSYPSTRVEFKNNPNAFDQIFSRNSNDIEARIRDYVTLEPLSKEAERNVRSIAEANLSNWQPLAGFDQTTVIELFINHDVLNLYGLSSHDINNELNKVFKDYTITDIKRFGQVTPIIIKSGEETLVERLTNNYVVNKQNTNIPLGEIVRYEFAQDNKYIMADRLGVYQAISAGEENLDGFESFRKEISKLGLNMTMDGGYFDTQQNLLQLAGIMVISILLLYFILAAQFESFLMPLIVILTLPLGVGGSLIILFISDQTINIMSVIGMIVMLGIIVNDSILKIDTMNGLLKEYKTWTVQDLKRVIHQAGEMRLKPIIMTSLTTILALAPVLFSSGIGADLQRPLAYSVIGGLTIGTLAALFFIPLAYYILKSMSISGESQEQDY